MKELLTEFKYDDLRISHLLGHFDDHIRFIKNYDGQFECESKEHEKSMLKGYRNTAFGMLISLFHLGHLTTEDFHQRLHALNTTFYKRAGY